MGWQNMGNPFHKGQRVQYSQKGRETFRTRSHFKLGTVAHNPETRYLVSVRWDGAKYGRHMYHVEFIEPASCDALSPD